MPRNGTNWMAVGAAAVLAVTSAEGLAGKPGGGTPPADPRIACAVAAGNGTLDLVVMNADGTSRSTVLDPGAAWISDPAWSPDGGWLTFKSDVQGPGVYVIRADGTGLRKVTPTTRARLTCAPAWSPASASGEWIAFVDGPAAGGDGTLELFVVHPDGTGAARLTDTPGVDELGVSWSPTADRIAVHEYRTAPGRHDVVVHTLSVASGGALAIASTTNLTGPGTDLDAANVGDPSWAKTKDVLAVTAHAAGAPRNVWKIDVAAPAQPTQLTFSNDATAECIAPSWSPDDTKVAYRQYTSSSLFTVDSDGGSGPTRIAAGSRSSMYRAPDWRR